MALLVSGMLALIMAGCTPQPPPPLRVGTNVWLGYEPLYLARDLGYFEGGPVHLVEYASATEVLRAFRNHAVEAAALTLDEALLLLDSGQQPRVVLVMDVSNGADVILGRAGMRGLGDLKGRRIGVEHGALGAYVLARALTLAGMTLDEIQVVPLPAVAHERAFLQHEVDAVVTFEPVRTRLLQQGAAKLFDSSQIPGEIVDVLVVRSDYLEREAAAVAGLVQNWFRALAYVELHPEDAAARMRPRLALDADEIQAAWQLLRIPDIARNLRMIRGSGAELLAPVRYMQHSMRAQKLLRQDMEATALLDASVIEKVMP
ncbi:MAG: ABC transporter substrate-binding protein [Gammaproteobacteria bacterium]|nr:ABC transporter substrate-binding protein [Gammaproteobacteria bacterium]